MKARILKVILTLYFMLIPFILILLRQSAVTGYEISIYKGTPLLAWFVLIGGIAVGASIIIYQVVTRSGGRWWLGGFSMLLMSNFIICSLFAIRGYYIYNPGDPLGNAGLTKDILETAHLSSQNFYPVLHILWLQIKQICDVSLIWVAQYLPAFCSVLCMVFIYFLARLVLPKREQAMLAAAASVTLTAGLFHVSIYSQAIAYFMFPLALYLYFKASQRQFLGWGVLFIILLIAQPFIHPYTSLVLIAFLVTIEVAKATGIRAWNGHGISLSSVKSSWRGVSVNLVLISFVTFFAWMSQFIVFDQEVVMIYKVITGQATGQPKWVELSFPMFQLERWGIIQYYLRSYGHMAIYAGVSAIAIILIIRKAWQRESGLGYPLLLAIWVVVAELFSLLFFWLVRTQTVTRLGMGDNLLLLSPIFIGFALYHLMDKATLSRLRRFVAPILLFIVIVLPSILGVLALYRSPYVFQLNWQWTYAGARGTEWFFRSKDPELLYCGLGYPPEAAFAATGVEVFLAREDIFRSSIQLVETDPPIIPSHFDYLRFDTLGEQYNVDRYMLITEGFRVALDDPILCQGRIASAFVFGRWDFDDGDLEQLKLDPTVSKLYSNPGQEVFLIKVVR